MTTFIIQHCCIILTLLFIFLLRFIYKHIFTLSKVTGNADVSFPSNGLLRATEKADLGVSGAGSPFSPFFPSGPVSPFSPRGPSRPLSPLTP